MKINIVVPFKRLSGGIKVIFDYANYMVKEGHDVCIYYPMVSYRGKNTDLYSWLYSSVSNTFKKENWFYNLFTIKCVPIISRAFVRDADAIIATSWQTAYDVEKLPSTKGEKIYFIQGYEVFNGEKSKVDRSYEFKMKKITISKYLHDLLYNNFDQESYIIYDGIDDDEFISSSEDKKDNNTIMFMYHEANYKGSKEGLETIKRIHEKYPNVLFNMFGRRIPQGIPSYISTLENPNRKDLVQMYRDSDIFVSTSQIESWGLPSLEAMANKCAVVSFNVGAMCEIGVNERNVKLASNFDFYNMQQLIEELLMDKDRKHQIQAEGYKTALLFKSSDSNARFERFIVNACEEQS